MIIEMDTRNQKDEYVTNYLDEHGIKYIRNKLYAGDVKLIDSTKVIIDLKANTLEIANNLCQSSQHARIKREIERAREIGCERFIFLIKDDEIRHTSDLINWRNKRTQVKGVILMKVMATMKERYGCEFIYTTTNDAPRKILELLGADNFDKTK